MNMTKAKVGDLALTTERMPAEPERLVAEARRLVLQVDVGSWRLADIYADLYARDWSCRRIATACATSKSAVSRFILCARRCPTSGTRPPFWEVFKDVVRRSKQRPPADEPPPAGGADVRLHCCRFQELEAVAGLAHGSVNLVLTDIPYGKDFLPQLDDLAALASRVLVEGGLLVTYVGTYYLPHVLDALGTHLDYRWTLASVWDGDANVFHPLQALSKWKPVLVFSKGPWQRRGLWPDLLHVNDKAKSLHDWQQPLEEAEALVRYFSQPVDLVCDPCCGAGTVALAAARLGRRCVACDVDPDAVHKARRRLEGAMPLAQT
jgi:SAM-dependent methyltransferase